MRILSEVDNAWLRQTGTNSQAQTTHTIVASLLPFCYFHDSMKSESLFLQSSAVPAASGLVSPLLCLGLSSELLCGMMQPFRNFCHGSGTWVWGWWTGGESVADPGAKCLFKFFSKTLLSHPSTSLPELQLFYCMKAAKLCHSTSPEVAFFFDG